jgi:uncharacterized protein (DUF2062 family)
VRHPLSLDPTRLWNDLQQGWDVYAAMLVGSIVLATPITLLTYLTVKRLAEKWVRQRSEPRQSE